MTSSETVVIGVDPGSKRHGVAVYRGSELVMLTMMKRNPLVRYAKAQKAIVFIEKVTANNFMYARNTHPSKAAQSKIAIGVGRNQQAQVELVEDLMELNITVKEYPPQSGNWANSPKAFQMHTGWTERSNKDTRSAAYFGWLGINSLEHKGRALGRG